MRFFSGYLLIKQERKRRETEGAAEPDERDQEPDLVVKRGDACLDDPEQANPAENEGGVKYGIGYPAHPAQDSPTRPPLLAVSRPRLWI